MSQEQTEAETPIELEEEEEEEETLLRKPAKVKKPRPPKTEAQMAAFAKAREARHKMMFTKNKPVDSPSAHAPLEVVKPAPVEVVKPAPKLKKSKPVVHVESDDEEEAQIVIVKKKSKPKVVYRYESDDEDVRVSRPKPKPKPVVPRKPIAAPKVNYAQYFY